MIETLENVHTFEQFLSMLNPSATPSQLEDVQALHKSTTNIAQLDKELQTWVEIYVPRQPEESSTWKPIAGLLSDELEPNLSYPHVSIDDPMK
jgi:hypothetical protein